MDLRGIQQLRTNLQQLAVNLEAYAEIVAVQMAQTGIAVVRDRSQNEGIFQDGIEGNYAEYSINPMLTVRFQGKELNAKGRDFIAENRLGTWQEFREAQGLPSDKVNLTYSGRMWASISILRTGRMRGRVVVEIGSADPDVLKYIGDLAKRYGNFIKPTRTEQNELSDDAAQNFFDFIKRELARI